MPSTERSPSTAADAWPRWIAHRGAGRRAPENTLAAFRHGWQLGYRAFECDVKLSADGEPYLMHDDTLERTTSGQGPAAAADWASLSRLDAGAWCGPGWAGEPPARLAALAAFANAEGLHVNLELKPLPGQAEATGQAVADAVRRLWHPGTPTPWLSSFQPDALAAAAAAAPELPRALLLHTLASGWLDSACALGCQGVVLHHPLVEADTLRKLRARGLACWVYTVNEADRADALWALGVDRIITDTLGP